MLEIYIKLKESIKALIFIFLFFYKYNIYIVYI